MTIKELDQIVSDLGANPTPFQRVDLMNKILSACREEIIQREIVSNSLSECARLLADLTWSKTRIGSRNSRRFDLITAIMSSTENTTSNQRWILEMAEEMLKLVEAKEESEMAAVTASAKEAIESINSHAHHPNPR